MTPPLFEISQTFTFDSAHTLPIEGNQPEYFRTHGHSFTCEVTMRGTKIPAKGWVMDLGLLKDVLGLVRARLDHRMLNEIPGLGTPTLENIAEFVAAQVFRNLMDRPFENDDLHVYRITVMRTTIGETCVHYPTNLPGLPCQWESAAHKESGLFANEDQPADAP